MEAEFCCSEQILHCDSQVQLCSYTANNLFNQLTELKLCPKKIEEHLVWDSFLAHRPLLSLFRTGIFLQPTKTEESGFI